MNVTTISTHPHVHDAHGHNSKHHRDTSPVESSEQVQGDQATGLPSLADFLHALADQIASAQRETFSFAISARGSFVSTSA